MTSILYAFLVAISIGLWTPLLLRFFRQWRQRDNPISLAICGTIALIMWWVTAGSWLITSTVDTTVVVFATAAASALTAVSVHIAFYRSRTRFADQRSEHKEGTPWRSAP